MINSFKIVVKKEKRAEKRKIEGNIGLGVKKKKKLNINYIKPGLAKS